MKKFIEDAITEIAIAMKSKKFKSFKEFEEYNLRRLKKK